MKKRMKFDRQMVVAHRGASACFPDNTIAAFYGAIRLKADVIETDIRKTKDNVIVLYHDESINDILIKDLTYVQLKAECKKNGFDLATLEEGLIYIKGKITLDIEFKETGYTIEAIKMIQKHLKNNEFYIRSFHDEVLLEVKEYDESIITALLLGKDNPKNVFLTRLSELFPVTRIKRCRADYVSPHYKLLRFHFLERMKHHNISVSVWTVNEEKLLIKLLLSDKVDSIVTNVPDLALRILDR
jgi:glycerophosphoryl diester phosphodiesterase